MKEKLDGGRLGMVFGNFLLVVHVIWVLAILVGLAQGWLDFIFRLHMLDNPVTVGPLNWGNAVMLWIVVWIVGYVMGHIFAWVHNWVHKN